MTTIVKKSWIPLLALLACSCTLFLADDPPEAISNDADLSSHDADTDRADADVDRPDADVDNEVVLIDADTDDDVDPTDADTDNMDDADVHDADVDDAEPCVDECESEERTDECGRPCPATSCAIEDWQEDRHCCDLDDCGATIMSETEDDLSREECEAWCLDQASENNAIGRFCCLHNPRMEHKCRVYRNPDIDGYPYVDTAILNCSAP